MTDGSGELFCVQYVRNQIAKVPYLERRWRSPIHLGTTLADSFSIDR